MVLLEVKDLKLYYKTKNGYNKAVDGISFSIDKGKSLGIVGESGCGKSTAVKGIIQVMPKSAEITGGEILFEGENLDTMSRKRIREIQWNKISLIPQAAMDSLNPVYRVEDPFLEILTKKGGMNKSQAKERIKDLFEMVGLDPARSHYYPHEFSGGMKQRVIIALALALSPMLVIADEPVTALDVIVQEQILTEIQKLRKELGLAMIMITHDISVVAETCDDVVVMYAGKIVEKGTAKEVLLTPSHPYTMGLENSFPKKEGKNGIRLLSIEGAPPSLINPPEGCRFAPRCPFAKNICSISEPESVEISSGHFSKCHFIADIANMRIEAKEEGTWIRTKS